MVTLYHKVKNINTIAVQAWSVYTYLNWQRFCLLKNTEVVELSIYSHSWKIMFEPMIGNYVIYEVGVLSMSY
jgi:hypothetical protein